MRARRIAALAGCVMFMTVVTTGCGGESVSGTNAAPIAPAADEIDLYQPGAADFYRSFRMEGARSAEYYETLKEAVPAASAVVVAEITGIKQTRIIQGEMADDRLPMIGVILRPVDVLAGQLPPEFAAELTVEFIGSDDPATLDRLKADLPAGHRGLWFLRHKTAGIPGKAPVRVQPAEAAYFRTVSPQGLFVQGPSTVDSPLVETDGDVGRLDDMSAEGRRFTRLSELVGEVRRLAKER